MERYIIVIDTERVNPPFGRKVRIRYATEAEIDRAFEDPNGFLPDRYTADDDGDLWVSVVVHERFRREVNNDGRAFAEAGNLLCMTDTHLFRGEYEGLLEILGAKRDPVAHIVDKRARRVI